MFCRWGNQDIENQVNLVLGALEADISCEPRLEIVKLEIPSESRIRQMIPSHVSVARCGGEAWTIFYNSNIIPRLLSPDHGSLLYQTTDKEGQFENISLLPAKLPKDFALKATDPMKMISVIYILFRLMFQWCWWWRVSELECWTRAVPRSQLRSTCHVRWRFCLRCQYDFISGC